MPDPDTPPDADSPPPGEDVPAPTVISKIDPEEIAASARRSGRFTGGGANLWQPPSLEEAGGLFPNYEVLALLGRGGMGAVYQARQVQLDRLVAIKLLPLEISVDVDFADRFRREARAMAKLNHPNIIAVHDFGTTSAGHLFFVMEFVDGANLHAIIHGPGLEPAQALSITVQVCEALAFAHEHGVVHRDIKPANVMVDQRGRAKVADFGLARLTDPGAEQMGHTMTGTVMGTPDYMAPEQMKGMNVDHRADIYSLGVMLYEMLCQDVPRGVFDPPSQRAGVDARLDDVVRRAMQQQPERRYQQTTEMRADVDQIRTTMVAPSPSLVAAVRQITPQPKAPDQPRGRRQSKAGVLIALATVALVFGVFAFLWTRRPAEGTPPVAATSEPVAKRALVQPDPAGWQPLLTDSELRKTNQKGREFKDGLLHLQGGLAYKNQPTADGAIRVKMVLREGTKDASVKLRKDAAEGGYHLYLFDGWGTVRLTRGSGGDADSLLGSKTLPKPLKIGDSVMLELRAQRTRLTALVDGVVMIEVDDDRVTERGQWGVTSRDAWFESIEVQSFASPAVASASALEPGAKAGTVSTEKWVDVLAKWKRDNPNGQPGFKPVPEGVEVINAFAFGPAPQALTDVAVRVTARSTNSSWGRLTYLRHTPGKTGFDSGYVLSIGKTKFKINVKTPEAKDGKELASCDVPAGWAITEANTIEFRAEGDKLTALVNGREMLTARDSTYPSGGICLHAGPPTTYEKFAYAKLEGVARPAGTNGTPFINSLGMKFVPVPITGGPTNGKTILFGVWETRVQDYEAFAKETGREWSKPGFPMQQNHPAVNVSWDDATAFCAWLTQKERKSGAIGTDGVYRLPSGQEWSDAVGADPYPWGKEWPLPPGRGNYAGEELRPLQEGPGADAYSWIPLLEGYRDDFPTTAPVGSFPPNARGLFDLGGNVWEWCEDLSHDGQAHLLRGASWNDAKQANLASDLRVHRKTAVLSPSHGFRVVFAP